MVASKLGFHPDDPGHPTVIHALDAAANDAPGRTALICRERSLTYAEYRRAAAGLAHRLQAAGAKGSRVCVVIPNSIETPVAGLGAFAAGAQLAQINPAFTSREAVPLMRDTAPAAVVTVPSHAERVRADAAAAGVPEVIVLGEGDDRLEVWAADASLDLPRPLPSPDDPSIIFFTGGTTGIPKGADHLHRSTIAHASISLAIYPLEFGAERIVNVAPMFHIWGFMQTVVNPIYTGQTIVLEPAFHAADTLTALSKNRATVFAGGPPAMYVGLLAHEDFPQTDLSSLKYCLAGGAPCSAELHRRWEAATGCPILEGIGMSEGAPTCSTPAFGVRKVGSTGPIVPGTEMEIVDVETGTQVLPPGERGEVRCRGPQFMRCYRNRPDETAQAMRDGWLYTGDIGYLDEDGYLFVVDRKKEMILVGGFNVYPREIDEVLTSHPSVMEAAAVGVPDDFRGETVKACIAPLPGKSLTEDEVLDWCRERLVKYKVPTIVEFFESLPKTGPGKIDKLVLRGLR